ncbi:site-2 protease family protein [Candidatus Desulfovibrio trichonymphae]|uniref:Zn-dependent M50 family peptidase n=1 Tax=Candidatus Desulfovibrio trichonymphae TaxID=1725232 RepID=A0A1J1DUW4_9BACT|nr:site-2 protease family protein [Candidatus Desulfovibrio trichonymphae]BAV91580.1 Zn-dependent M50 family peptidase [Candidatus Desulfovibrio trichonymphae]GHU89509.1 peptidase M50 [Deltaproteobacteria bacterium]GHV00200.1 peptidase M50 [Deltaproteobacteria bacterium]
MFNIDFASALRALAIAAVPTLLGIILHEVAHGYVAFRRGDPTAAAIGRLTLNPLPHIDPMGLIVFGITSLTGSFVFGWAKPVPVNPRYFRNPAKDMMLVALAGPLTNFFLAFVFGGLLRLVFVVFPPVVWQHSNMYIFALTSLQAGVVINFGLGWLNLLPIPPLDGSKVLSYFLQGNMGWRYIRLERYGFVILLLLLFSGLLNHVLGPLVDGSVRGYFRLLGL